MTAKTPGVILEGFCFKINSFPRVPISSPESEISAPLLIYCGEPGHGYRGEVGVYVSHTGADSLRGFKRFLFSHGMIREAVE